MNRKIIIILAIAGLCLLLLSGPAFAKENVKVKISTDKWFDGKGVILIKLVDSHGREIHSNGKIKYTVTDSNGNYKWESKAYNKGVRVKYDVGSYNVKVNFYGDNHYKSASKSKDVTLRSVSSGFDAYTYYDNHNWGLNQEVDDYIEYNYWDEEIYDDASNYDGEGY